MSKKCYFENLNSHDLEIFVTPFYRQITIFLNTCYNEICVFSVHKLCTVLSGFGWKLIRTRTCLITSSPLSSYFCIYFQKRSAATLKWHISVYFFQILWKNRCRISVRFPSHLKTIRSLLRFWLEKLNCGFFSLVSHWWHQTSQNNFFSIVEKT